MNSTLAYFLKAGCRTGVEVPAYCFMPDHVHLLTTAVTVDGDLGRFMRLAKQMSGYAFKRATGHRLWQTGYHERVLRPDDDALDVIAYMVENPIRGGLVTNAQAWPHWGSVRYTREEVLDEIALRGNRRG